MVPAGRTFQLSCSAVRLSASAVLHRGCDPTSSSACHQHQIPNAHHAVGSDNVALVRSVPDLGIYVDSDVPVWTHVVRMYQTVSPYFAVSPASVDRSSVLY